MADLDPRRTLFEAMVPAADEALREPAPDWLLAMLRDAGLPVSEDPSVVADRLTAQSVSFGKDVLAGQNGDALSVSNDAPVPRLAPTARTMLGWEEDSPDPDDRFAARLMAAFQSGALDVKPAGVLPHPTPARDVARNAAASAGEPKRCAARGQMVPRSDLKHQTYPAGGVVGRSLYAPW